MRSYLIPAGTSQKSFGGKAVIEGPSPNGEMRLYSYNTLVLTYCCRHYTRFWSGYSSTTMRHIRSFIGGMVFTKTMWESMPLGKPMTYKEICGN